MLITCCILTRVPAQLDMLPQKEIASRLTLNCLTCDPKTWKLSLPDDKITLIDVSKALACFAFPTPWKSTVAELTV